MTFGGYSRMINHNLHSTRHGKLTWSELFEPSIRIARNGFKATELLALRVAVSILYIYKLDLSYQLYNICFT